jgi:alkyl hydroperoxide reductase subunit AhpC
LGKVDIPLLADLDKIVSKAYGAMLGSSGHTLRYLVSFSTN